MRTKSEGARFKNVFGSYLHGSFLPKNPHFADLLIKLALEKRYGETVELTKLEDELETKCPYGTDKQRLLGNEKETDNRTINNVGVFSIDFLQNRFH